MCFVVSVCCVGKEEAAVVLSIYAAKEGGVTSHMSPQRKREFPSFVPEKGKKINDGRWAWLKDTGNFAEKVNARGSACVIAITSSLRNPARPGVVTIERTDQRGEEHSCSFDQNRILSVFIKVDSIFFILLHRSHLFICPVVQTDQTEKGNNVMSSSPMKKRRSFVYDNMSGKEGPVGRQASKRIISGTTNITPTDLTKDYSSTLMIPVTV